MGNVNMKETEYYKSGKHHENLKKAREVCNTYKDICPHCHKEFSHMCFSRHEPKCYLNPINVKLCVICNKPVKNKKRQTCSHSCSNTFFRSGLKSKTRTTGRSSYIELCFRHHERKCIICEERLIVHVHHLDHNRDNNIPENLIPLCPTHHRYWHSKYRYMVEGKILKYIKEWYGVRELNSRSLAPKASAFPDSANPV